MILAVAGGSSVTTADLARCLRTPASHGVEQVHVGPGMLTSRPGGLAGCAVHVHSGWRDAGDRLAGGQAVKRSG